MELRGHIYVRFFKSDLGRCHHGSAQLVSCSRRLIAGGGACGVAGSSSQAEADSCVSYLHFPVSHSMAPLSHLLVYYVRENGEGVTDSVQIPVQPDFENQVCMGGGGVPAVWMSMLFFSVDALCAPVSRLFQQSSCAPNCCYDALYVNQ